MPTTSIDPGGCEDTAFAKARPWAPADRHRDTRSFAQSSGIDHLLPGLSFPSRSKHHECAATFDLSVRAASVVSSEEREQIPRSAAELGKEGHARCLGQQGATQQPVDDL